MSTTRYSGKLDDAADDIMRPVVDPSSVETPGAGKLPEEIAQNVRDILTLVEDLKRDPNDAAKIGAIRGFLDEMRQYDPPDTNPVKASAIDDFAEAVETFLAKIATEEPEPDGAGAIGETANVGKSLGEIAGGWFPEIHRAGAWPFPQQGAPGSGLAGFYLAGRRVKKMAR
jgi:hypothetical protein